MVKQNRRTILRSIGAAAAASTASSLSPQVGEAQHNESDGNYVPQMRKPYVRPSGNENSVSGASQNAAQSASDVALPSIGIIALNRIAYGPRPGDLDVFDALGSTDEERLTTYVDQQLDPDSLDDTECDAKIAAQNFQTMELSLEELWLDYGKNLANDRYLPLNELEQITYTRACYSNRQLLELLFDFWHNHFNIYPREYWIAPTFLHFSRDVIRKHALGNFRELVEAVGRSPSMLYYLDNRSNKGGDPNENYARELFELHTLGAENYLGVKAVNDPSLVDDNGERLGYVDEDVYGATTCFTGWQVDVATGQFVYDEDDHFPFQKFVMGRVFDSFQGEEDGHDVYDILTSHPGTARYICRKLCRRFISDEPSESVVQAAADVFLAQKDAPDQIAQVMRTILLSDDFRSTWGEKMKRPFELTMSVLRASNANFEPIAPFPGWYEVTGQSLFRWSTPDGYPDNKAHWSTTMTMLRRWQLCTNLLSWTVGGEGDDKDDLRFDFVSQMPSNMYKPRDIVDYWSKRLLGRTLPEEDWLPVVNFMAQGRNIDFNLTESLVPELVQQMILLIFMSPSFQWR